MFADMYKDVDGVRNRFPARNRETCEGDDDPAALNNAVRDLRDRLNRLAMLLEPEQSGAAMPPSGESDSASLKSEVISILDFLDRPEKVHGVDFHILRCHVRESNINDLVGVWRAVVGEQNAATPAGDAESKFEEESTDEEGGATSATPSSTQSRKRPLRCAGFVSQSKRRRRTSLKDACNALVEARLPHDLGVGDLALWYRGEFFGMGDASTDMIISGIESDDDARFKSCLDPTFPREETVLRAKVQPAQWTSFVREFLESDCELRPGKVTRGDVTATIDMVSVKEWQDHHCPSHGGAASFLQLAGQDASDFADVCSDSDEMGESEQSDDLVAEAGLISADKPTQSFRGSAPPGEPSTVDSMAASETSAPIPGLVEPVGEFDQAVDPFAMMREEQGGEGELDPLVANYPPEAAGPL